MKKSILLAVILLNCFQGLVAQQSLRFGVQVSPTFSWMQTNDKSIRSNGINTGLKTGMLGELYFADNYALLTGISLTFNNGGTLKHDQGGDFWANSSLSEERFHQLPDGINTQYHIQYLEIPVALRMRTREFGYLRYFAEVPRFLLGVRTQAKGDLEGAVNTTGELITADVNPFTLSWGAGGGVEYSISPSTAVTAGLFFQSSILDITRNKNAQKFAYGDNMIVLGTKDEHSLGQIQNITLRIALMF